MYSKFNFNFTIYIIFLKNIHIPNCFQIFQDVSAALSSVMAPNDVIQFFQLKRDAKLDLIYEYRSIVCGIYIYNKESGLCGRDHVDIRTLVVNGHASTESMVNMAVDEVESRIAMLTSFLEKNHNESGEMLEATKKDESRCSDVEMIINVLIMHRQHMSGLVNLVRMVGRLRAEIDCALRNFNDKLELIRTKVQFKTAIPTDDIFVSTSQVLMRNVNKIDIYELILATFSRTEQPLAPPAGTRLCS